MSNQEATQASPADFSVIRRPVITEKGANGVTASLTLEVDPRASKDQIRQAVERVFGAEVESVRTLNQIGKPKRSAQGRGRRSRIKKAYVQLKEGQHVDIVEGV